MNYIVDIQRENDDLKNSDGYTNYNQIVQLEYVRAKPSRLEIAAMAMQGILSGGGVNQTTINSEWTASKALQLADELIKQEAE